MHKGSIQGSNDECRRTQLLSYLHDHSMNGHYFSIVVVKKAEIQIDHLVPGTYTVGVAMGNDFQSVSSESLLFVKFLYNLN